MVSCRGKLCRGMGASAARSLPTGPARPGALQAWCYPPRAYLKPRGERRGYMVEKARRQKTTVIPLTLADPAKIMAESFELVALRNHDPRPRLIQPEVALDRHRNYDCPPGTAEAPRVTGKTVTIVALSRSR